MSRDLNFKLDRISNLSREKLEEYIKESKPFILEDYVTQWPAFTLWQNSDYLMDKIGKDTLIPVRTNFTSKNPLQWLGETANIRFEDFINHWKQNKVWNEEIDSQETFYYLASLPIGKHFQSLAQEIIVPYHAREQQKTGNLWIGNAGQITPIHYDYSTGDPGMDGLHAMISGRKIFLLFDPALNQTCFTRKTFWGRFHQAETNSGGLPDPEKYPNFKSAKYIEIELKAGEALFIPKLWWHYVKTLEPSIAVNFWWQHLESEKLKLTRHWGHMTEYLKAVELMKIPNDKMKNVLQWLGEDSSDTSVEYYQKNIYEFMLLPSFIDMFSNGTKAPWMQNSESKKFAEEIKSKVRDWVLERKNRNVG